MLTIETTTSANEYSVSGKNGSQYDVLIVQHIMPKLYANNDHCQNAVWLQFDPADTTYLSIYNGVRNRIKTLYGDETMNRLQVKESKAEENPDGVARVRFMVKPSGLTQTDDDDNDN